VPPPAPPAPLSAVPRRLRQACAAVAALVVAVMAAAAWSLGGATSGTVRFGPADQVAMLVLGLLLGAAVLALGRFRVDADAAGVRVRGLLTTRELPWSVVRAVQFGRKSPWASLLLENGDEVALVAVQAVDGERAVAAVEGLRTLLAAGAGTRRADRE
jgi:Bacterial PH domain